jgi:hypothetical protein
MSHQDPRGPSEELGRIADLLRDERPELGAAELDRIKLRAMASRRGPAPWSRKGNGFMRKPAISLVLVVGMLGGGSGALAAAGVGPLDMLVSDQGASKSQYCPPTSQNPGALKKPGSTNCGHPKTKVPPGQAKKLGLPFLPPGQAKKLGLSTASSGKSQGQSSGNENGHGKAGGNGKDNGGGKGGKRK